MTLLGPDISSYQSGLDLSKLQHADFVIAKTTEGTYYSDGDYDGWRRQAAALNRPFMWYHFLTNEATAPQITALRAHVGDPRLSGMLDCEPGSNGIGPTLVQIMAFVRSAHSAGLWLELVYLPHWYWQEIGSPDLRPLMALGVSLVSSFYTPGGGQPGALYRGDTASSWDGYGNVTPMLLQFTNRATDGGMSLDYNAFRGTEAEFQSLFNHSQGDDMAATFATGQVESGIGARTVICPPPANTGTNWRDVWVSFGADFGTAVLRVAGYVHGSGWQIFPSVSVPANSDRVNPFGGPAPAGLQKISVVRVVGSEEVPVGWLVEAQGR